MNTTHIFLGNPLAFTAAYEQIILSQSQSSINKQDSRQPMNLDNRINRVIRMQHNNPEIRDRRSLDTASNTQDSLSERSDTEVDSAK